MPRSRDVRNAIRDALLATDAFGEVSLRGAPEDWGMAASVLAAAVVEPLSGKEEDRWDDSGGDVTLLVEERALLTLMARQSDPQLCDEAAELLLETAKVAINGKSLAGLTMPDKTRVAEWRYLPRRSQERRIVAQVAYGYLPEGWDDFDTSA